MAHILSVDDDPDVSNLLRMLLRQQGYEVDTFHDGYEALRKLEEGVLSPDLILLDVDMPVIDGYGVCERLQAHPKWCLIPTVFLTGSSTEANRLRAFQLGAVGFLSKPVDPDTLPPQIEKFLKVGESWRQSFAAGPAPETPAAETSKPAENSLASTDPTVLPVPLVKPEASLTGPPKPSNLPVVSARQHAVGHLPKSSQHLTAANQNSQALDLPGRPAQSQAGGKKTGAARGLVTFAGFKDYYAEQTGRALPDGLLPAQLYEQAANQGIGPTQLARYLSEYCSLDYLEDLDADKVKLGVLPAPFCRRYHVVPIREEDKTAFVISHPFEMELEDTLQRFGRAKRYLAEPDRIQALHSGQGVRRPTESIPLNLEDVVDEVQTRYQGDEPDVAMGEVTDEDAAPLIRLVNRLIENAYRMRASDIHIEPAEAAVVVRYRIDGDLRVVSRLQPPTLIQPLVARLKIMSGLNISERRLPQDGRIVFKEYGNRQVDIDLRVATAPMNFGEKVVMRIIDKQKTTLPLEALGFSPRNLLQYRQHLSTPYGMILHVGPTGSGKSMTLYAALNEINRAEINIQTAEDPIEYTLPNINQLQVKPEIGLTFARALRSYLRQDPDVILVGEIRDRETAHIAAEAALTGHLLLSTLHTNDAAATLTRLMEMGIEPFMVSASVVMICAQRLLRRLCEECAQTAEATLAQKQMLNWPLDKPLTVYNAVGCERCDNIGYRGRIGVHELMVPSEVVRNLITEPGMTAETLKRQAVKEGMTTLFWDGVDKALQGLTSLEEVAARVRADDFDSRPTWWLKQIGT